MHDLLFVSGSLQACERKQRTLLKSRWKAGTHSKQHSDLAEVRPEFYDGRPFEEYQKHTQDAIDQIMAASVLVFASPVYQGSIPGSLKNLFDLLPRHALTGKGAVMLSIIGSNRFYLSPGYHLRPVLEELQATVLHPWLAVEEKLLDVMGHTRDADLLVRMRSMRRGSLFSRLFFPKNREYNAKGYE